jgi:cellulose synthase/poly-beta-1,6-N-acetylglucosamine synthase-like glycosyltransferase
MNKDRRIKRILEIIPGGISWSIILSLVLLAVFRPVVCAVAVIIFDFYWIIRTVYLTTLLIMAHRKLTRQRTKDWLKACTRLPPEKKWQDIYHLVIFPIYNEGVDILRVSLEALKKSRYPLDKFVVVAAFEERHPKARENARILEREFGNTFFHYMSTFHPDGLPGERRLKGANATWAARKAREFLAGKTIPVENVIISCFDADTCVDREYFGCLTYHFLVNPRPHQASYQPIPVYNNNIWYAPSLARIVELSSSFCQMIESMRLEKFVTFSSHSMSFKTLIEINYWPVDMISDDSVVYWKAFLFYKGDYRVIPLYTMVSMDMAYGSNIFSTMRVQYRQKRRWAWGVENFPFLIRGYLRNPGIPFAVKFRRGFNLLEAHVTWAIWAVIIIIIAPLPVFLGKSFFEQMPIAYNLPRITGLLLHFTVGTSLVWIVLSRAILPPRPKGVHWGKHILMIVEWVIVPWVILLIGSTPALDAQTRLMLAKYMEFSPTEKRRNVV